MSQTSNGIRLIFSEVLNQLLTFLAHQPLVELYNTFYSTR